MNDLVVQPGVGIGPAVLGQTREQARASLGEPDVIDVESHTDGSSEETWHFSQLGLELTFDSSLDWRLAAIGTSNPSAVLNGVRFIGVAEAELPQAAIRAGMLDFTFDEDFDEFGRDFESESFSMSVWVQDGHVTDLTLYPLSDSTGDVPQWPL